MTLLTREWLRKADADRMVAVRQFTLRPPAHDIVCFLCQQAIEKYLKGLIVELGLNVPKTHDLDQLLNLLLSSDATLKSLARSIKDMTDFAVDYRYPGMRATKRQANSALSKVERVRAKIRRRLGLRS